MIYLGTYELPFGKGQKLSSNNPMVSRLIGGWSSAPVFTWASGLPIETISGTGGEWANGFAPWYAGMVPLGNVQGQGNSDHAGVFGDAATGVATAENPVNGGIGHNIFTNPNAEFNLFRQDIVGIDGPSYDYGPWTEAPEPGLRAHERYRHHRARTPPALRPGVQRLQPHAVG